MASEQELLREIEKHATELAQSVAAAEKYYQLYTAEIERELEERLATNQAEYDQAMDRIQREHDQAMDAVHQELREVEQICGLWGAPWNDAVWDTFSPDPEAPVPFLTRLGRLCVSGIHERGG